MSNYIFVPTPGGCSGIFLGNLLLKRPTLQIIIRVLIVLVFPLGQCFATDIDYSNYNAVRNGEFEQRGGWFSLNSCYIQSSGAKDGEKGIFLQSDPGDDPAYCYQQLTIPSILESATVRFDYRAQEKPHTNDQSYYPVNLQVHLGKSSGTDIVFIGSLPAVSIDSIRDWAEYRATLDQQLLTAVRTAHQEGDFVFIIVSQAPVESGGNSRYGYATSLDNLSLSVEGTQRVPKMEGLIAYSADDLDGNPVSVGILEPNTRNERTIWTRPGGAGYYGADVAWSPDGSEVAFVSDHERNSSALTGDIYAIKPTEQACER